MSSFTTKLKIVGAQEIIKKLTSKDTVKQPVDSGIRKLAISGKAELVKSTVVDKGTARSNIASTPIQYASFQAVITHSSGPGSSYIPYLETGTSRMAARHMKGSAKVIGKGMFTYVKEWLQSKVEEAAKLIAKDIAEKF